MAYGIEVIDTDGTTTVLSPDTRYLTRMTSDTTIAVSAGSNTLVSCNMTGLTTSNSELLIGRTGNPFVPRAQDLAITRESNGFRVTNNSHTTSFSGTLDAVVYVVRF